MCSSDLFFGQKGFEKGSEIQIRLRKEKVQCEANSSGAIVGSKVEIFVGLK